MAIGKNNNYVQPGTVGLLFIEPQREAQPPVIDDATKRMVVALRSAQSRSGYRGAHTCRCGAVSDNVDHVVGHRTGAGVVKLFTTNSLAVHYLACHRDEVPPDELADVLSLPAVHAEPSTRELTGRCSQDEAGGRRNVSASRG